MKTIIDLSMVYMLHRKRADCDLCRPVRVRDRSGVFGRKGDGTSSMKACRVLVDGAPTLR